MLGTYDFTTARNGHGRFVTGDTQLDELLIHDRALSASEVSTLSAVPEPSSLLSLGGLCLATVLTQSTKESSIQWERTSLGGDSPTERVEPESDTSSRSEIGRWAVAYLPRSEPKKI